MDGKITYHQQVSYCGKPRCRRCREGVGHGPYWYAYQTVNGRTVRSYVGKQAPPEIVAAAQAQASGLASPEFAHTLLRLSVLGQFRLEQRGDLAPGEGTTNNPPANGAATSAFASVPLHPNSSHDTTANGAATSAPAALPQWERVTEAALQHQRVRALLCCLASSAGRKLGREQIMFMLWPELDMATASNRLDRAVHTLRQIFEPGRSRLASSQLLLTEHSTVALADQELLWIDADAFESLIARGRASLTQDPGMAERLLEEATRLYRGDFMPDEHAIECVKSRRESLRRAWIGLLLELADLRLARESIPGAIDILDRLLAVDPTSEAAVQRLMLLLAQMGRRGEAIQAYQLFASLLQQDYQIAPLPETRALYERVRGDTIEELVQTTSTQPTPAPPHTDGEHRRDTLRNTDARSDPNARPGAPISPQNHPPAIVRAPLVPAQPSPAQNKQVLNGTQHAQDRPALSGAQPSPAQDGPALNGSAPPILPAHMNIGRAQQSPLVGREREMGRLVEMLGMTEATRRAPLAGERRSSLLASLNPNAARRPQFVMLMGDVGIGKTRLAEEIAREAKRHDWAVAWCRAYTQESSVPYRLWIETLRKAMSQGLWQRGEVTRRPLVYQPLRHLLPELQDLLPPALHSMPPPPEQEQLRLWESTRALLSTICEHTTLLIVLDDIQWADQSSCELLTYLVRQMRGLPVLFLCTCRDSELAESHPLRSPLNDLQREQAIELIRVEPLNHEEMHKLLAHLPAPMVESISERASGNPFFAEELARELAAAGRGSEFDPTDPRQLPETIQAVLELRLARISQPCQRVLERGAVLGRSFGFGTICEMASAGAPADEDLMIDLLEEAMQAGMLTEEGSGMRVTYHFWHPLLQAYLYEHLSYGRRASLHRRAAQVLQDLYAESPAEGAAEIADHLVKGGGVPASIAHYAELAADRAYSLSAYPDAEKYYHLLLSCVPDLAPDAPQSARLHCASVLERLGECTMVVGKYQDAHAFYEQVLALRATCVFATEAERQYEAQIEALLWGEVGQVWRYLGDRGKARESFRNGEEVLRRASVVAGPAWARIRYQEGHTLWLEGKLVEALAMANEALALVESFPAQPHKNGDGTLATLTRRILDGDPISLGRISMLVGTIEGVSGQSANSVQHLNTALSIFEKHDYRREIGIVCSNLGNIYLGKAEYDLAQAAFQRALDIDEKIGDAPNRAVVQGNLGVLAARLGNLVEAEDWYRQALALTEQVNDLFYMSLFRSYLATALIEQGRLDEAKPLLVQALKISRSRHIAPCTDFALAALGQLHLSRALASMQNRVSSARQGRVSRVAEHFLVRARAALTRAVASGGLEADSILDAQLHLARIALLLGEPEQARELAASALDEARAGELVWLQARAQLHLGQIFTATGEQSRAESCFLQALASFANTNMRLEHARSLQAYSLALLQGSGASAARQSAQEYLQEAAQVFAECRAALDLQSVEAAMGIAAR